MSVVQTEKFIYVELGNNNNKQWSVSLTDNGDVITEWGRVGFQGQSKTFPRAGQAFYDSKIREKTKKGYVPTQTLSNTKTSAKSVANGNVAEIARKQIQTNNPLVQKLIERLARENVHNLLNATALSYDESKGTFSTPLGIVTQDGILSARNLLTKIGDLVEQNRFHNVAAMDLANSYLRIVPMNLGMKRFVPEDLFPNLAAVQKQNSILDSLEVSLATVLTAPADGKIVDEPQVFRVKMEYVEDGKTIDRIRRKYNETKQSIHMASRFDVKTVYSVEIESAKEAFEKHGKPLGNIMELWHGSSTSNLLSILKSGLKVSPPSSAKITGKMWGPGIYASDQSTKALNYAAGYWSGSYTQNCFMFLVEFAMGRIYTPRGIYDGPFPKSGYDSVLAKAGVSGVINNESIVYQDSQANLKYLIEFSR